MALGQNSEVRDRLLQRLIGQARRDPACASAALLGSAARGDQDEWSDIDFAVRLVADADLDREAERWALFTAEHVDVVDTLDVRAWGAIYLVFFCADGLQIDLSLWPWHKFRAVNNEPVDLLFGDIGDPDPPTPHSWLTHARMAWLYALHARSAIRRGRVLQADQMLSRWRDRVISLTAMRHGLDPRDNREAHLLPEEIQAAVAGSRPASLEADELHRAMSNTVDLYLVELRHHDPAYGRRLATAVASLAR